MKIGNKTEKKYFKDVLRILEDRAKKGKTFLAYVATPYAHTYEVKRKYGKRQITDTRLKFSPASIIVPPHKATEILIANHKTRNLLGR